MARTTGTSEINGVESKSRFAYDVLEFVRRGIDVESSSGESREEPFWRELCDVGTELWLDSGDMEAIEPLWNAQFTGLTTNNTLLNNEVQKGVYDELIPQAGKLSNKLDEAQRVREIAFILNTRHALRLVEQFRCRVSVELHTDLAHDREATLGYARRCHEICPEYFVVKVPFTAAGLIATRELRGEGVPVNLTLGFSARQNHLATALANPSFVNVFLGRLNSYVADNHLGDGQLVGEKATLASQQEVKVFALGLPQCKTRQIAASLRDAGQLTRLAGVDVITMPPGVAGQARKELDGTWRSRLEEDYQVSLAPDVNPDVLRLDSLWSVSADERRFVEQMILDAPQSAAALTEAAWDHEVGDLFPKLSTDELQDIADGGKIPEHQRWGDKIMRGELAVDSLMTLAGLEYFAASQKELDQRIREKM